MKCDDEALQSLVELAVGGLTAKHGIYLDRRDCQWFRWIILSMSQVSFIY